MRESRVQRAAGREGDRTRDKRLEVKKKKERQRGRAFKGFV